MPYRAGRDFNAAEPDLLQAFLDDVRDRIAGALDGLTDEQARRSLVPSLTTVLGIVKHAAFVERVWFRCSLGGESREAAGVAISVDDSFRLTPDDTVQSVRADFLAAVNESRRAIGTLGPDDQAMYNRRGPVSLRWIYVHVIQELACHVGHAEILREQLLAGA